MKKLLIADAALAALIGTPALAADMARQGAAAACGAALQSGAAAISA